MKNCPKWVHVARYEFILRLERALWLTIIFKPLLTPKGLLQSNLILILDVCDRKCLHDLECNDGGDDGQTLKSRSRPLPAHLDMKYFRNPRY